MGRWAGVACVKGYQSGNGAGLSTACALQGKLKTESGPHPRCSKAACSSRAEWPVWVWLEFGIAHELELGRGRGGRGSRSASTPNPSPHHKTTLKANAHPPSAQHQQASSQPGPGNQQPNAPAPADPTRQRGHTCRAISAPRPNPAMIGGIPFQIRRVAPFFPFSLDPTCLPVRPVTDISVLHRCGYPQPLPPLRQPYVHAWLVLPPTRRPRCPAVRYGAVRRREKPGTGHRERGGCCPTGGCHDRGSVPIARQQQQILPCPWCWDSGSKLVWSNRGFCEWIACLLALVCLVLRWAAADVDLAQSGDGWMHS